ncbi:MAG: hypothetical protein ABIO46_06370 [Chitinophagales bacterium]
MLRIFFILFVAFQLQSAATSFAQVSDDARFNLMTPGIREWFPGWYITLQNDTVKGYIYLSNQIDNQMLFKYATKRTPTMDEKTFEAAAVKGYLVKDRVYESVPIESTKSSSLAFARRIETGRLNLFAWYNIPNYGTMHDGGYDRPFTVNDEKFHESVFILKIGNGKPVLAPSAKDFAEVMSTVVADNKDLSNRIAQKLKGYRSGDLLNIVQQYNSWFITQR